MNFLAASNVTWIFRGLLVAGLIIAGWTINQWRTDAAKATDLKRQLEANQALLGAVNRHNARLSADIEKYKTATHETVREVVKNVKVYIKDNRSCDLPVEAVDQINRAMGYE